MCVKADSGSNAIYSWESSYLLKRIWDEDSCPTKLDVSLSTLLTVGGSIYSVFSSSSVTTPTNTADYEPKPSNLSSALPDFPFFLLSSI